MKPEEALAASMQYTNDTMAGAGGLKGDPGASAYEIAVANGFEGSEKEWLESLKASVQIDENFDSSSKNPLSNDVITAEFENIANNKQNNLIFDETPKANSTNPVTSGGVYNLGGERLRRKIITPVQKDYVNFVIPLCSLDNTNPNANYYFMGNVQLKRSNTSSQMVDIDIVCGKHYNSVLPHYSISRNGMESSITIKPVTFLYNNIKYFGLYFEKISAYFTQCTISGEMNDWNIVKCLEVYNRNTKEVLNSEICDSVEYVAETQQLPHEFYTAPYINPNGEGSPYAGKRYKVLSEMDIDISAYLAKSEEYSTGRIWLDGSTIYRKDFVWKITGLTTNQDNVVYLTSLMANAIQTSMYVTDANMIVQGDATVSNIHCDNTGYKFKINPTTTEIVLTGFIEYVLGDYSSYTDYTATT